MLTDAKCRNAVCPPDRKQARFPDSGGMYLQVSPAGSKRWFLKYRVGGAEKQLALGSYPGVTLTAARKARDAAKLQKSEGIDPLQARKVEKLKAISPAGDTFKATAEEWYAMKLDSWSSHYAIREKRNLEKDLFPFLGSRRVGEIEAIELLATVRRVEERGALDVAHRVLTTAGQVWRYAVATGRAKYDVSADIKGALKPHHGKHFAAITDPVKLGELIRIIRSYQGGPIVRAALLTLGYGPDVQSVHGFRATARTILAEVHDIDPLVIEAQLAHAVKDANGRSYNRTTYLKHRATMMQQWADYLDKLARGADVIPIKAAAK